MDSITKCPACGAPIETGEEICSYCGHITPYGEKKFQEREKKEQEEERRKKLDNLPAMKYVSGAFIPLLYIFTLGFWSPYWYAMRMNALNNIGQKNKLPAWLAGLFALACAAMFLLPSYDLTEYGVSAEMSDSLYSTVVGVVIVLSGWLAFIVRGILQEHAAKFMGKTAAVHSVAPSNVMLILFGPAYLQYQVNKMIKMNFLAPKI